VGPQETLARRRLAFVKALPTVALRGGRGHRVTGVGLKTLASRVTPNSQNPGVWSVGIGLRMTRKWESKWNRKGSEANGAHSHCAVRCACVIKAAEIGMIFRGSAHML